MTKLVVALSIALSAMGAFAQTELDPSTSGAPKEIIVREDAQGNREVFKVSAEANVQDEISAQSAIANFVTAENKIKNISPRSELDQTTSQEAWYYWYNPYYYSYGYNYSYSYSYNYYGYSYYYQPYYYYNYGYYNYYYYRF